MRPAWTLLRPLGRGATGRVWRARDAAGREAAVKVLPGLRDATARRLLAAELTALGRLRHPLAPRLLWVGEDRFAMALVCGRRLDRALPRPSPAARLVPLLLDLLDVLAHAHALGIIHCDLKPENLLVERVPALPGGTLERLHVVDFGLAEVRALEPFGRRQLAGTLAYMAPEQRQGRRVDGRADLYGVGAIARDLLGKVVAPFDRFLAADPADRPATAEEAIALAAAVHGDGGSPLARPPRGPAVDERLRLALATARVPEALRRRAPARGLGSFLVRERAAGHLRREGRTWSYAAPLSRGDALQRDGRGQEAIEAYTREGNLLDAADLHERRQEYDQALALLSRAEQGARSLEVRLHRGIVLCEMRHLDEAAGILRSVRRGARGVLRARAAYEEGYCLELLHRPDEAAGRYREALRLSRRARQPALAGKALRGLGLLALRRQAVAEAERLFREGLASIRASGEWDGVALMLSNLGTALQAQLRLEEAAEAFAEALGAYRRIGDRKGALACLLNVGNIQVRRLDLAAARRLYEEALGIAREIADAAYEGAVRLNFAAVDALAGRFDFSLAHAGEAVRLLEGTANVSHLGLALRNRGDARRRGAPGDPAVLARAEADFLRARELAASASDREVVVECELDLAEVEAERGFLVQAAARATRAFREAAERGYAEHAIRGHVVLAAVLNRGGLHEEALAEAREAERKAAAAGTVFHRLEALGEGAAALAALGREEEARAARDAAEAAAEAIAEAAADSGEPA